MNARLPQQNAYLYGVAGLTASVALVAVYLWVWPGIVPHLHKKDICRHNVRAILIALQEYHSDYGTFPPASIPGPDGTQWHSWRVLILPYLNEGDLYEVYRFDEPWSSPQNMKLKDGAPAVFRCPEMNSSGSGIAHYLAVVGSSTIWSGVDVRYKGGTCNHIQIVESANSTVLWHEPQDVRVEDAERWPQCEQAPSISAVSGAPHVGYAGGCVEGLPVRIRKEKLMSILHVGE